MNKILILTVVCVGIVWTGVANGVHISGMDFDDNFLEDEEQNSVQEKQEDQDDMNAKLAETCLIQILGPSVSCVMRSLTKWNVNPHQLKIDINHKPTCCSIWEMTDCLLDKAQLYCSEDEKMAFEAHLSEQTQNRNEKNCSRYQYKSDTCNQESNEAQDDSNVVYNDVVIRDHGHFIKPGQFAQEALPQRPVLHPAQLYPAITKVDEQPGAFDGVPELAQRLLDRVERITIHKMVIELHPAKGEVRVSKHLLPGEMQFEP